MGNKCFKPKKYTCTSYEANLAPRSRRWRLFQALGLGKFCAKVDIQREDIERESLADIGEQKSVTEYMREDPGSFSTAIAPISMLDNEIDEETHDEFEETMAVYPEKAEKIDIDQDVETNIASLTTVSVNKGENINTTAEEEQVSGEKKEVDAAAETELSSDIGHTKIDIPRIINVEEADVVKELASETQESTDKLEKDLSSDTTSARRVLTSVVTRSDKSSSSDHGILQRRPLSPGFFSTTGNKLYDEFEGETEEEIEECIEIEEEEERYVEMDIATVDLGASESKKATRKAGIGKVILAEEDVKAAILKLAFLREGKDSNIDYIDINKATKVNSKTTYLDATIESNLRKDHPDAEITLNVQEVNGLLERNNSDYDHALHSQSCYEQQALRVDKSESTKEIEKLSDTKGQKGYEPQTSNRLAGLKVPHKERKPASLQNITVNIDKTVSHKSANAPDGNVKESNAIDKSVTQETSGKTYKLKEEVSSSISVAIALSLEAIKNHHSRSDCMMSFYVRSPQFGQEPRKVEVRASAKQVKDGSAEKHVKLLKNIQIPAKSVCPEPVTPKRTKKHLFTVPALAEDDSTNVVRWIQNQGSQYHANKSSVPVFYETTEKTKNPREKLGLEKLQKYKIGLQCKQIERIKIDAEEFPGILPPRIREKWRRKMDERKRIN